jgi:hypothetical protein
VNIRVNARWIRLVVFRCAILRGGKLPPQTARLAVPPKTRVSGDSWQLFFNQEPSKPNESGAMKVKQQTHDSNDFSSGKEHSLFILGCPDRSPQNKSPR